MVMIYPRSFSWGTLKVQFSGFSLMLKSLRLVKVSSKSVMRLLLCQDFMTMSSTDLQVAPNLSFEVELHTPLVGGPRVL
jgi:hypothetical protein